MRKGTKSSQKNVKNAAGYDRGAIAIMLPKPSSGRSVSVFAALRKRRTIREIGDRKLSLQQLSDLAWAACGINRRKGPFGGAGITAASASNSQEIELFVARKEAMYRYEPSGHRLLPAMAGDFRSLAIGRGQSNWGKQAPVRFVYVVDMKKFSAAGFQEPGLWDPDIQKSYYYVDTGLAAANVYVAAASMGLACWFHNCNKQDFAKALNLKSDQRPLFGQTIGYPAKRRSPKLY